MEWILENWMLLVAIACALASVAMWCLNFAKLPLSQQEAQVKQWLLWAVTQAEAQLGGGTGALKLRYVYDMFAGKFPWLVPCIQFELFSSWVDDALETMRAMLETNDRALDAVKEVK